MKHFVLFLLFSFFIIFNRDVNAKVEQSLNEYKIEQLQKGIDDLKKEIEELKKDVDDTKEKKIENKKDNESLDKRIGDINFNITTFAIFITVLLLGFGFFGYRNAKADAKKEAEDTTKNWLENDGKNQLNEIIQKLQKQSEKEFSQLVNEKTNELNTLFENFKQEHKEQLDKHEKDFKQLKEQYIEKKEIQKDSEISQEKEIKTFDDYLNMIVQYAANNELDTVVLTIDEAEKLENLTDDQIGLLYFAKGLVYRNKKDDTKAIAYYLKAIDFGCLDALFNLGVLYKEQKEYKKAEKYYLRAIDIGDSDALHNLRNLYTEQKEYEKLEQLKQKYKI
jgi:tetratricopeptide (TPR) repeat protein